MPSSQAQIAKRELVTLLLVLAVTYSLGVGPLNRDSRDQQILSVYRKVVLKVHPDKGGDKEDAQKLQDKKDAWEKSRKSAAKNEAEGYKKRNKATKTEAPFMAALEEPRKEYRIQGTAVMLQKKLRAMDLKDSKEKRFVLGKMAYQARVIRVLKSVKARKTAKNIAAGFRKICVEGVKKKGAATSG